MNELEYLRKLYGAIDAASDRGLSDVIRRQLIALMRQELEEHVERKILEARRKRLAAQFEKDVRMVGEGDATREDRSDAEGGE